MLVGLIGLGNMGTAIANLIASNGFEVLGWEYDLKVVSEINDQGKNSRYLPGINLSHNLKATSEINQVASSCEIIFIAIPSVFIRPTLEPVQGILSQNATIVNMAKGIDANTGLTSFQTIGSLFPTNRKVMLSGPTIANEFAREMPTVVVLASERPNDLLKVAQVLDNDHFRTRFSDDASGVELGGILKNIYTIGLGLFDGKQITSVNFRAVYLTIAMEEIARIGEAMGAKIETFLYLAGIGDLLATSLSQHSHNRQLGEYLAHGLSLEEIKEKMGVLPEGFNTLKTVLYIAEKLHISMPLARGLWDVIHGRYEADKFIKAFIKDFVD
jgi:glycerol-3-phosphate dehydrogenase (NAD(P)+)